MNNGKPYRQQPVKYEEQLRCCLGYVPRPPSSEGVPQPARRPYDCTRGCMSLEDCVGLKMEGAKA